MARGKSAGRSKPAAPASPPRSASKSASRGGAVVPASPAPKALDPKFAYPPSFGESEPFSKPHTVTILLVAVGFVVYTVLGRDESSTESNVKK